MEQKDGELPITLQPEWCLNPPKKNHALVVPHPSIHLAPNGRCWDLLSVSSGTFNKSLPTKTKYPKIAQMVVFFPKEIPSKRVNDQIICFFFDFEAEWIPSRGTNTYPTTKREKEHRNIMNSNMRAGMGHVSCKKGIVLSFCVLGGRSESNFLSHTWLTTYDRCKWSYITTINGLIIIWGNWGYFTPISVNGVSWLYHL